MKLMTHERQWRGGATAVAFGMFDGVHEGHAKLMRTANEVSLPSSNTFMAFLRSPARCAPPKPNTLPTAHTASTPAAKRRL